MCGLGAALMGHAPIPIGAALERGDEMQPSEVQMNNTITLRCRMFKLNK